LIQSGSMKNCLAAQIFFVVYQSIYLVVGPPTEKSSLALPETDPRSGEPHREEERRKGEEVHYGHHLCVKNFPVCLSLHEISWL
jgi:hypothetical protein